VRDQKLRKPDPQLGLKTAFHVLHTMAVILLLIGLSLSVGDLLQGVLTGNQRNAGEAPIGARRGAPPPDDDGGFWNPMQRTAAALTACGTLFTLFFWLLLTGTNNRRYPAVQRVFMGGRLALSLLVVFLAVTTIAAISVQKNPEFEPVELLIGVLVVWTPSAVVHLLLFRRAERQPLEPVKVIVVESSPDE
jgi:hypothetical protein